MNLQARTGLVNGSMGSGEELDCNFAIDALPHNRDTAAFVYKAPMFKVDCLCREMHRFNCIS